MRAAKHGFVEAVQTLLNAHARTDLRDLEGHGIENQFSFIEFSMIEF